MMCSVFGAEDFRLLFIQFIENRAKVFFGHVPLQFLRRRQEAVSTLNGWF